MNLQEQKEQLRTKISALTAKTQLTASERTQLNALIAQGADIRAAEERQARAKALVAETRKDLPVEVVEGNGSEFRKKFLSESYRTYQPLSDSTGAALIPSDFEVKLKSLMIADGPLFAGSPLLTNVFVKSMVPGKVAVSDDLAQPGIIAAENTALTDDAELTGLSGISLGANPNRYSTGILLASVALAEDQTAASTMEDLIAKAASARLSRIQNSTNLSALKTSLAANSSAAVAAAGSTIAADDPYTLVAAVGAAYRGNAVFIMSKAKQTALGALKSSTGKRMFPHVLESSPSLLNYPVYIISEAATDDILFGDYSYLFCKYTPTEMSVLRERFRTQGYYGYLLSERSEMKWSVASTSDSPVKYLTFA
jgi:HK97 family phage major capsid protein